MRSRNYTNEIGVNAADRPVPTTVALVILSLVAVVAIVSIRQVMAYKPAHQESAAEQPAPLTVAHH
jgi:hypothetical protein